jgi:hypothetical protein
VNENGLPELDLVYSMSALGGGPPIVYLTDPSRPVTIANELTLTINNPNQFPVSFQNAPGYTPASPLPPIGAGSTSARFDRIYVYFLWGGFNAAATATVSGGQVTAFQVTNGGAGYSVESPPQVTITGGGGQGATATATVTYLVTGVQLSSGGSGYTSAPTVTFSGGGGSGAAGYAVVQNGAVNYVKMTNTGSGYVNPPTVTFSEGGGSGAAGAATVTGSVSAIAVTNPGSDYTSAPAVNIPQSAGTNALCSLTRAQGITVSTGPNNTTWFVQGPTADPLIGVYWTLFPQTQVVLGPSQQVAFNWTNIISEALPGSPLLFLKLSITGYQVQTVAGTQVYTETAPLEVASFTVNPTTPVKAGTTVNLDWTAWGADYVMLNGGQKFNQVQGSYPVMPNPQPMDTSTPYQLQAWTNNGQSSAPATVFVFYAPTIASFQADPPALIYGQTANLIWNVTQASSASIDQGIGPIARPQGQQQVSPTTTTTYTLTAEANGVQTTGSVTILVNVAWVQVASQTPFPTRFFAPSVLNLNNKLFVIEQETQTVWSSPDGVNWTQIAQPTPWSPRLGASTIVFDAGSGPRIWLFGGNQVRMSNGMPTPVGLLNDVWSSPDGVNWTQVTSAAAWPARGGSATLLLNGKLFLVGGIAGSSVAPTALNDVWSSPDGQNWSKVTSAAAWPARFGFGATAFNNRLYVMGGALRLTSNSVSGLLNDVWSSPDGVTWTQAATPPWVARMAPVVLVVESALYLLGGIVSTGGGPGATDMWWMGTNGTWNATSLRVPVAPVGNPGYCFFQGVGGTELGGTLWVIGAQQMLSSAQVWQLRGAPGGKAPMTLAGEGGFRPVARRALSVPPRRR